MKSKDLLVSYYNKKYKFDDSSIRNVREILLTGYPSDRYESAIYWGRGIGRALEIGAGAGCVLSCLSNYYDEYFATEFSIERVKYLERAFGEKKNIKIIHNDIEEQNLDLPMGSFDTIIMVSVIEHLIEPISVIKYCYSLLRPNGRILIQTPNIAKWTRRLKLLFGLFPSTGSKAEGFISHDGETLDLHDDGHLHYFTFSAIKEILKNKAGFSEVKYCGYGRNILSRIFPAIFSECFVIGIK